MSKDDFYDYEDRVQAYWDRRYKQIDDEYERKRLARENASDRYFLRHRPEGIVGSNTESKRPPKNRAEIVATLRTRHQQVQEQLQNIGDLPAYLRQAWLTKLPQPHPDDKEACNILSDLIDEVRNYREKYPFHLGYTRMGAAEVLSDQLLTLEIQLQNLDGCFFAYHLPDD